MRRDHPVEEKPPWWGETTLIRRDHLDERPPWLGETTLLFRPLFFRNLSIHNSMEMNPSPRTTPVFRPELDFCFCFFFCFDIRSGLSFLNSSIQQSFDVCLSKALTLAECCMCNINSDHRFVSSPSVGTPATGEVASPSRTTPTRSEAPGMFLRLTRTVLPVHSLV